MSASQLLPLMDRNIAAVQRVDPAFDTPSVLAAHARRAGPRSDWNFLTGDQQIVEGVASRVGVSVMREDPRSLEVVRSLRTLVVCADGRLVKVPSGNDSTRADVRRELKAPSAVW